MPAYTSPDNIQYPVSTDQVAPLETVFANMAQSTQNAFDGFRSDRAIQTFQWADATARQAASGMSAGDQGFQQNNQSQWVYFSAIPGGSPAGWYPASGSAIASILGGGNATSGSSTT